MPSAVERAVALVVPTLLLAACSAGGAGAPSPATSSLAAIPLPSTVGTQTYAGNSFSPPEMEAYAAKLTQAVKGGDETTFLAQFDPAAKGLVDRQRRWFRNIQRIPFTVREFHIAVVGNTNDSSKGAGTFTADMTFRHQVKGADPGPVDEWYAATFRKSGDTIRVTKLEGAAARSSEGRKYARYFPAPWDIEDVSSVTGKHTVYVGSSGATATMRTATVNADRAVEEVYRVFEAAGQSPKKLGAPPRWVLTRAAPPRGVFDYFGGSVEPVEANYDGAAQSLFRTDAETGDLDLKRPRLTARIVMTPKSLASVPIIGHEVAHGLASGWDDGYTYAPTWVVEGFASYVEGRLDPVRAANRTREARPALRSSPKTFPKDFYKGNDSRVAANYGLAFAAVSTLMDTAGPKRGFACVATIYAKGGSEQGLAAALKPCGIRNEADLLARTQAWVAKR